MGRGLSADSQQANERVLERLSHPGTKARRLQDLLLKQWRTRARPVRPRGRA